MRFRILPAIIFFAFALVVAKVFDLALEKSTRNNIAIKSDIQASAQGQEKEAKKDAPNEDPAGAAKGADPTKNTDPTKGDPAAKTEAATAEPAKDAVPPATGDAGPAQKDVPKSVEISDQVPMERALLENLSKRRKELDEWANSISMKESVLNATEKKISSKMDELKKLETDVTALLEQYKSKEDEKTKRLVKIYEDMKPADAAKILDHMDMNILTEVVNGMKEANAAKILSKMDPIKAKELTVKLAEQKRLTTAKQ